MNLFREMLRFGFVGALGFIIDGGLLWILVSNGANPFLVRGLTFPTAVVTTWWLNRIWTFEKAEKTSSCLQLNRYFVLQGIGALTNFAIYSVVLSLIKPTPLNALGALAAGAVIGTIINFFGSHRYVFKPHMPTRQKK